MNLLYYVTLIVALTSSCNKRKSTAQDGTSNSPVTIGKTGSSSNDTSPNPTEPNSSTPKNQDNRPVATTLSSQKFECKSLDSGIYWFGKGDLAQKASKATRSSFFDPQKPTVIYVHGWQSGSHKLERRTTFNYGKTDPIYGLKIDAADAWIDKGWNIGIFYWNQISDETLPAYVEDKVWGTSPLTWKDCDGKAQIVDGGHENATELFLQEYLIAMDGYEGNNIRLAGHSLGNQMVTRLARRILEEKEKKAIPENLAPRRVALIDPWWSAPSKSQNRAETLKNEIQEMKGKGIIFEWYKTSEVNDSYVSDENLALVPVIGRTEIFPDYYKSINTGSRHMCAPYLYFLSFKDEAPRGCGGSTALCTELAPSAATGDERMNELMNKGSRWQQVGGRETATTSDNTFEPILKQ